MAKMGRYCKAYTLGNLREFSGWTEDKTNVATEKRQIDGKEVEAARERSDSDILYLQENFVVTDGIFDDENIVFDRVTSEWVEFCRNTLKFEAPAYEPSKASSP